MLYMCLQLKLGSSVEKIYQRIRELFFFYKRKKNFFKRHIICELLKMQEAWTKKGLNIRLLSVVFSQPLLGFLYSKKNSFQDLLRSYMVAICIDASVFELFFFKFLLWLSWFSSLHLSLFIADVIFSFVVFSSGEIWRILAFGEGKNRLFLNGILWR